jgi:hypothetical protein
VDQRQIDRLRAAGGRVGELSEVEWETLVDRHGTDVVAFATTRARLEHGRPVAPDEVGKHLPKSAKASPGAEREAAPVNAPAAPVNAPAAPVNDRPAHVNAPPAKAFVVSVEAEGPGAIAALEAVTSAIDARAEAAAQVEAKPEEGPSDAPVAAQHQRIAWRVFVDLIRARPGISTRELSALLGRSVDAINGVLRNHSTELRFEQPNGKAPRRWWLADAPVDESPTKAPEVAHVHIPTAEPENVTKAANVVPGTCDYSVQLPSKPSEIVKPAEPPAPRRKRLSKPSRALEPDPPILRRSDFNARSCAELLTQVVNAYAQVHELEIFPAPLKRLQRCIEAIFPS